MYRILISDKLGAAGLERLGEIEDVQYDLKTGLDKAELLQIIPEYDGLIVRSGTQVDADVLAAGTNLKVVGRAGMGVDNIDVNAATMRGVIVMNTPGANSVATAEQTMVLMLAVSRHTAQAHASLLAGEWARASFVGNELFGKTLGIIGFGRIGRLVAERAKSFGMEILAFDPYVSEEVGRAMEVTLVDLDDLLPQADYITLHTAVTPETVKMINADTISQMKDGVTLINVARGKLVDEPALAAALKAGKVKAAGIDVYSQEPPPADHPLLGLPNVVHTPHLGASSQEAQRNVAVQMVEQVVDALRGTDFRNALNMPFQTSLGFDQIRPYMQLGTKLGHLHAQAANGRITQVEIEVNGKDLDSMVTAIAAGVLQGILIPTHPDANPISAPVIANEQGISVTQTIGKNPVDYPNLISCRAQWEGGERLLAGVLFGGEEPRIVRFDRYTLDARPEGSVLLLQNRDVPGVVGQIGTILAAYEVNIGEWRMGRDKPGGEALSVINLDSDPPEEALDALRRITAVTKLMMAKL